MHKAWSKSLLQTKIHTERTALARGKRDRVCRAKGLDIAVSYKTPHKDAISPIVRITYAMA